MRDVSSVAGFLALALLTLLPAACRATGAGPTVAASRDAATADVAQPAPTDAAAAVPGAVEAVGAIRGTVRDADGRPVVGATVCVLDAVTGIPLRRATWRPFTDEIGDLGEEAFVDLVRADTGAGGAFRIDDVPSASDRLLAQSWRAGDPPVTSVAAPTIEGLLEVNGGAMHLHGTADVEVPAHAVVEVAIEPLGTDRLILGDHAPNAGTLLMLSTAAPRFDPVLGWLGWSGPFLRGLVGFNVMPDGETVVHGLPGGDVHVAIFSIDDRPGFGAATIPMDAAPIMFALVPFVADWSDARHRPPPHLAALVDRIARADPPPHAVGMGLLAEAIPPGAGAAEAEAGLARIAGATVDVGDGGARVPAGDLLAALAYLVRREAFAADGRRLTPYRPPVVRPAMLREAGLIRRRDDAPRP